MSPRRRASVHWSPLEVTGMMPARISRPSWLPPRPNARHTCAVPSVGMARERHFVGRREDAHQRRGALRRQDERGFRDIELARQRLHRGRIELAAVFDHTQRIAGQARAAGREHIEDAELEIHGAGLFHNAPREGALRETPSMQLREIPSNCTGASRSDLDQFLLPGALACSFSACHSDNSPLLDSTNAVQLSTQSPSLQ